MKKKSPLLNAIILIFILILILLTSAGVIFFANKFVPIDSYSHLIEDDSELEMLRSLPYAQSMEVFENDSEKVGVIYKNDDLMSDDYVFYDGKIINKNGSVIHYWPYVYAGIILDDGTYIAQYGYENESWGRFNFNGTPLWIVNERIHHDITLSPWNTVFVLSMQVVDYNGRKVEFDVIEEYSLDGDFLGNFSIWDNFEEFHKYHPLTELDKSSNLKVSKELTELNESNWGGDYQYYHMNNLEFVPPNDLEGVHPAFNPGNWILTFRQGNLVYILDKDTKKVLWFYGITALDGPHAGQMLPSGNVLIFDNGYARGFSRVLEVSPVNLSVEFEYSDRANDFYTQSQGWVEKESNGNYLITQTEKGRIFEITPDKEIVWEYWNPEVFDNNRTTIYRARPYSKDFIDSFLNNKS